MRISSDEICNGCKWLDFSAKKCTCARNNNPFLSYFRNSEGFVAVLPNESCGRKFFVAKKIEKPKSNI